MNRVQELGLQDRLQDFWIELTEQIVDVLDAHGICAAVGQALAEFGDVCVIFVLEDPLFKHLNAWICYPAADPVQTRWFLSSRLQQHLQENGEPVELLLSDEQLEELQDSELWSYAADRIIAVPIPHPVDRVQTRVSGAIFIVDPQSDNNLSVEHLKFISSQVTIFLDRAYLRQRSDRQAVEFGLISDISFSITSTLNIDEISLLVSDRSRRALGTEVVRIWLKIEGKEVLEFKNPLAEQEFQTTQLIQRRLDQGIVGWVAQNNRPAIVNDPFEDERFDRDFEVESGQKTESVLCVPLQLEDEVIGVLEASNKMQGVFDDGDLRLLQAISGPLSVAIHNAKLHNSVVNEKRRVETIFASMSEGMLTADDDGYITASNDALQTLLDYDSDTLTGRDLVQTIETKQSGFGEFINRFYEDSKLYQQLICDVRRKGGDYVPVIISGATVAQDGGERNELVLVFSDLTQIREIERMRDDFFSNIVHELHTPLATILMYARLLRKGKVEADSEKSMRFLEIIEQESNRLQKLVRQMLHLAKIQSTDRRQNEDSSPLNPVFDQLIPPLADRASAKGLSFEQYIQAGLPAVPGDQETLYMIFKNLLENAIKFTPAGKVSIRVFIEGDQVRAEIEDDGIGIPPESLPNLFSRFYRAQTAVERGIGGTGLGLYMVKEGLDYCGGTIDVNSQAGLGTTFIVHLPIAAEVVE